MKPLGWAPIQSEWYPYKRKFGHTRRHQEGSHTDERNVSTKQEGNPLQAEERGFRRNQTYQQLNLGLLASRT